MQNNEEILLTQSGLYVKPEKLIKDIDYTSYDFLIIPGGKAVSKTLINLNIVDEVIKEYNEKNNVYSGFIFSAFNFISMEAVKGL